MNYDCESGAEWGMGMVEQSDPLIYSSNHPTFTKQHAPPLPSLPLFREGVGVTGCYDMTQQHKIKEALASNLSIDCYRT